MAGIGLSYQGYDYYMVDSWWRCEKDGVRLPERFGVKSEVKRFIDARIRKEKERRPHMKELQKEGGITRISLENIELLVALHGPVRFLIHYAPAGTTVEDMTFIVFRDGFNHTATGFASGYAGEGPRGLHETIQEHLKRDDIMMEHIAGWRGSSYMILNGQGNGEEIHNFVLISAGRLEVW